MSQQRRFGVAVPEFQTCPRPGGPLSGRYVTLDPLHPDHAAQYYEAARPDDTLWDYLPYGPFTRSALQNWVDEVAGQPDPAFYAIIPHNTGRVGGVASLMRIKPEIGVIEIGHINFTPSLQQSRAATEAIYLCLNWAFLAGYRRFEWKCDALNQGSRNAAQRFGFSFEGIFRQATIYKGRNRDTAWFAITDGDWLALQTAFESWLAPSNFTEHGRQKTRLSELTSPALVARDPSQPYSASSLS